MFQALEEGIVLIKKEKIMFTNTKFTLLMQEAEGDSPNFLDRKFLSQRKENQTENDPKSLRSLLSQDPGTLQEKIFEVKLKNNLQEVTLKYF